MMAVAAVSALALSMIWLTGPVLATHVDPTFVAENVNSCEDLGLTGDGWNLNAGDVQEGEHTYTNGDWTITITADADLKHFSFSDADPPVLKLAVKAGDGYYLYDYSPGGATEDDGIITPNNGGNDPGQPQAGLSHFFICFGEAEESVAESEAESVAESASGEQSVEAGTGTPEESAPDGALFGVGSSPLPTIAFSLILLASLGGLAYANVRTVRSRI
jgi:hypothetical protein